MNVLTRVFLVLLRLAIGWHFLIEGLDKIDSHYHWFHSAADGKRPWSSEAYLKESTGPLAWMFREQLGDPNEFALERLTLPATKPGERPQLPPALKKDWEDYFARFVAFYHVGDDSWVPAKKKNQWLPPDLLRVFAVAPQGGLPGAVPFIALGEARPNERPDRLQLILARTALDHAEQEALDWLARGKREVERSFSRVSERVTETTPNRISAYREKLRQLHEIERYGLPAFGRDVWKQKLVALKDEVTRMRTELLTDVNRPMKEAMDFTFQKRLTSEQRALGPLPETEGKTRLWWINQITMWGLTAVGTCLLLGLFTRTACLGGAAFLLAFYLAMPSLPWLPANPRAEGHYLFVNKNIIEMLALLALATTHSGRWAGLDGLLYFFGPWRLRKPPRPVTKKEWGAHPGRATAAPPEDVAPTGSPPSRPSPIQEPSHGP
jgi:uncharacterized membrane protein YphA (DoxX/SURF4 family)